MNNSYAEQNLPKVKVDFNEYMRKSFGDNIDSHMVNEQLPSVIDKYCNELSNNNDFMTNMMKH